MKVDNGNDGPRQPPDRPPREPVEPRPRPDPGVPDPKPIDNPRPPRPPGKTLRSLFARAGNRFSPARVPH